MGKRREGREAAVQFLFAHELHSEHSLDEQNAFWEIHSAKPKVRAYAEELIRGVLAHITEIDAVIAPVVENFRIERLANVDRNILRVAVHELMHVPDVPGPVIMNEAIEVAKNLSGSESGAFVNGILHKIAQRIRPRSRPAAAPAPVVAADPASAE
jgi:N utilization substance protein B